MTSPRTLRSVIYPAGNMAPKRLKRSEVWLYFTGKDDNRATCNTCKVDISTNGGNTTNMQKHLLTKHAITLNECRVSDPLRTSESQPSSSGNVCTSSPVNTAGTAHLQCSICGHYSKSHAHQLSHMAAFHPSCLDDVVVGRLGNILIYQSTARLFHCSSCFYTCKDFNKLYKHIITKHCVDEIEGGGGEGCDDGSNRGEEKTREEGEEDEKVGVKESLKRQKSSEADEEEKGEGNDEDGASQRLESDREGGESVLLFDGAGYSCLICGWKNKLKALGVNHVVRKHEIPKTYASQAIRRDSAMSRQTESSGAEEDEMAGLSGELLKEEMEATAKVIRFVSNRFVCLTCGWKTKLKGFAISHVVRCHDVERPYSCKDCKRSFFLPSRLQQHIRADHRPGRYACPFCCFRSHFLGGFRRHCSRCNAREEGEGGGGRGGGGGEGEGNEEEEEVVEERKETRAGRRRRRAIEEVEEREEDGDDDDE